MVPTNSISVFLRHNNSELRRMVGKICRDLRFCGNIDDVVQDVYVKILTSNILQSYNRHYCTGKNFSSSRMSTYLFPIIRNFILTQMKNKEYKYQQRKLTSYDPYTGEDWLDALMARGCKGNSWSTYEDQITEVTGREKAMENYGLALEFRDIMSHNDATDRPDGLAFEIRRFYEHFRKTKSNKKFGNRLSDGTERSLSEIFRYLYEGYSNKDIARIYGVTNMTITHLKHKLAEFMLKYGFTPDGFK